MKCDVVVLQVTVEERGKFGPYGSHFYFFNVPIEAYVMFFQVFHASFTVLVQVNSFCVMNCL